MSRRNEAGRWPALPDAADFGEAKRRALAGMEKRAGIGTLKERSLHAVLKYWFQPDDSLHEVRLGRFVADIFDGGRVVEIQTRNFYALRSKLEAFLTEWPVLVVYPLARRKTLSWIEPDSGEASPPRRSPKVGRPWEALPELLSIRESLGHPRLAVAVVMLDMEEYRLRDGWGRDGKRGSHRAERIPAAVGETILLQGGEDLRLLLPPGLPEPFTAADFGKASRLSRKKAGQAITLLYKTETILRIGKRGNAFLYSLSPDSPEEEQPTQLDR